MTKPPHAILLLKKIACFQLSSLSKTCKRVHKFSTYERLFHANILLYILYKCALFQYFELHRQVSYTIK